MSEGRPTSRSRASRTWEPRPRTPTTCSWTHGRRAERPPRTCPSTWWSPAESALRGPDLYLAGSDARLVARLRVDGRAAEDLAAADVEAGAVPRADHDVAVALAVRERPAEMRARRGDRAHLPGRLRARDEHVFALELDADELAVGELALLADRRVALARGLERGPVDADAEAERELAAEMRRDERACVGDAREQSTEAAPAGAPR